MNGKFFYTTVRTFQWHNGINIIHYNDDGELIASLEEAKALARAHRNITMRKDHVDTAFGVEYFDQGTKMTPMLGAVLYLVAAVIVGAVYHKICAIEYKYDFENAGREEVSVSFAVGALWFIYILPMLWRTPKVFELHAHVKREKAVALERKNRQLQIEKRKQIIKEINADIDRLEQTRREDVMPGREIFDTREGEAKKRCYICNQTRSPYVRRRSYNEHNSAHNGTLINTISNVPAHEECIMGDLEGA